MRYGPVIQLKEVVKNNDGSISHAKVEIVHEVKDKVKGYIHWVSKENSLDAVCNLYSVLFLIEDIKKAGDKWLDYINPKSLVVRPNAKIWNTLKTAKPCDRF